MTAKFFVRTVRALLLFLLVVSSSVVCAANVLIIGHAFRTETSDKVRAELGGHTVTIVDTVPTNLDAYDVVWDLQFNNSLTPNQTLYLNYLASGKRLLVVGEHNLFMHRNNTIVDLVRAAGGGDVVYEQPRVAFSLQTVQSPFTGPNPIQNNEVGYGNPGGLTTPGDFGQFITVDPFGVGTGIAFGRGTLRNASQGVLVVMFDIDFMDGDLDAPDDTNLLRNIIAYFDLTRDAVASTVASGLNFPFGVAVSGSGALYIADHNNHKVWRAGQTSLELLAGAASTDAPDDRFNGEGIDATLALLDGPSGVAVDAAGNIYIADSGNHIVRKVSTGGIITTVAGTPTDNSLDLEGAVLEVGNGGLATSAVLNGPRGVAVDGAGNLYVVDTIHQQVRKVDSNGIITVVAGVAGVTGSNDGAGSCPLAADNCVAAKLNDPRGVAVDGFGNVFIADSGNDKIRKVTGNVVTTVATGPLDAPTGVAVASDGTLYIADHNNNRIQRVSGANVTTVPVTGLSGPYGIALDPATGDLYVADKQNHRILKVDFTPAPPPILLLSEPR